MVRLVKRVKWLKILAVVAVVVVGLNFFFPAVSPGNRISNSMRARADVWRIVMALKQQTLDFGRPPTGSPATVLAVLRGENRKKIVFLEVEKERLSAAGEFLDPWGDSLSVRGDRF